MQTQTAKENLANTSVNVPIVSECDYLLDRVKGVYESIAHRAYEFFVNRGHQIGHDVEDWLRAEMELLRPIPVHMEVNETEIKIKAELPGFKAEDIEVSAEPRRLVIHGTREKFVEEKKGDTTYSELNTGDVFRALELPEEIDPEQATAQLKNGLLEITMLRVKASEPTLVEIKTE
jgi:HSP20 family protein